MRGKQPPKAAASGPRASVARLLDQLRCHICHESLHRAASVQPCLHSFCSHCLGRWLCRADLDGADWRCPLCRTKVLRVAPNCQLDGLVEELLASLPVGGDRRSGQDLAELDEGDVLRVVGYDLARLHDAIPRCTDATGSVRAALLSYYRAAAAARAATAAVEEAVTAASNAIGIARTSASRVMAVDLASRSGWQTLPSRAALRTPLTRPPWQPRARHQGHRSPGRRGAGRTT